MRCQRATELMSLRLDQMLDQAGEEELEKHLKACPMCASTWTAMQGVSMLLAVAPMVGPAPGFTQRVKARIARRQSRRQLVTGYLVLAAGLLLIMALPLAYLAMPVSHVGRAVAQDPQALRHGLGLLARFGAIAHSFGEACWLLARAVLGLFSPTLLLAAVALCGLLLAIWAYLVSGHSLIIRLNVKS